MSVRGKAAPDIPNPAPCSAAALMVRATVPEEVSVSLCAAEVEFTVMSPKLRLDALRVRAADPEGGGGFS